MPPRTAAAERALPVNVPASVRPPLGPSSDVNPLGGVRSGSGAASAGARSNANRIRANRRRKRARGTVAHPRLADARSQRVDHPQNKCYRNAGGCLKTSVTDPGTGKEPP